MANTVQIDLKSIEGDLAICLLYTSDRVVTIAMSTTDYKALQRDGFFVRDGKTKDSAGVINTTRVYAVEN